uniref:Uncharacterized protein n=1 Tax=Aegilops tauschii subsp. strangulata TaxID=200361 RepID=A0A453HAG8_AEGTS
MQRHYADFLCFWNLLMKFWLSALTWPVILSQITVLEFVNEILQSDLAVLMILKFMLLCGYKNMAVNNSYAFQRLQMPQGLPNKGSLKRNGLTKKGRSSSRSGSMAPSLSQQEERGPQRRPDLSSPHAAVRPP